MKDLEESRVREHALPLIFNLTENMALSTNTARGLTHLSLDSQIKFREELSFS